MKWTKLPLLTVILICFLFLMPKDSLSQNVAINADGSPPHPSAVLDLQATDKGLLLPRISGVQREAIVDPAEGLLIFQTGGNGGLIYFDGADWRPVEGSFVNSVNDVDGNAYDAVILGNQKWFARNLEVTHFRNGEAIPLIASSANWAETNEAAAMAYNGMKDTYKPLFGLLYNAFAVNDLRGLCPEGWKIPGEADWQELVDYLGDHPGGRIKSLFGWESPNSGAINDSGFSALPAGQAHEDGTSGMVRYQALFWSAGESGKNHQAIVLKHDSSGLYLEPRSAKQGLSVRCVKNDNKTE